MKSKYETFDRSQLLIKPLSERKHDMGLDDILSFGNMVASITVRKKGRGAASLQEILAATAEAEKFEPPRHEDAREGEAAERQLIEAWKPDAKCILNAGCAILATTWWGNLPAIIEMAREVGKCSYSCTRKQQPRARQTMSNESNNSVFAADAALLHTPTAAKLPAHS